MTTMTVVVKVRLEKREEFLQAMRSLNNGGEKPRGLKELTLYQGVDDHSGFSLIYQWETQEDMHRYLDSEKFRVLRGAFKVLCEKSQWIYDRNMSTDTRASSNHY